MRSRGNGADPQLPIGFGSGRYWGSISGQTAHAAPCISECRSTSGLLHQPGLPQAPATGTCCPPPALAQPNKFGFCVSTGTAEQLKEAMRALILSFSSCPTALLLSTPALSLTRCHTLKPDRHCQTPNHVPHSNNPDQRMRSGALGPHCQRIT